MHQYILDCLYANVERSSGCTGDNDCLDDVCVPRRHRPRTDNFDFMPEDDEEN